MAARALVKSSYKEIMALGTALAACASSLLGNLYIAMFLVGTSFAFYLWSRRRVHTNYESELYGFVRALLRSYKRTRSMLKSLGDATTGHSAFEKDIRNALERYRAGDIHAFSSLETSAQRNAHSAEAVSLISRALVSGDDVYVELCRLKYSVMASADARMKRLGAMSNARFVSLLGIVLFFPLFAGIGTAILAAAPQSDAGAGVSITSITFIFAAYLLIECFVHFEGDAGMGRLRRAASIALGGSFAMLLLKAGSVFAISAI